VRDDDFEIITEVGSTSGKVTAAGSRRHSDGQGGTHATTVSGQEVSDEDDYIVEEEEEEDE
jgi:RecJ-like exonuclease